MKLFIVLLCVHLVASQEEEAQVAATTKDQFTTKGADFSQIKSKSTKSQTLTAHLTVA